MDLTKLIQMIVNMVLRKAVSRGVDAGIDYAARRGKPAAAMSEDDLKQAADARALAKRARQAAKLTGRLGR